MQNQELQTYMTEGIGRIVKQTLASTVKNPKESAFVVRYAAASKKAAARRRVLEQEGLHIPPFLIASITSQCNLHCKGCYSRQNEATSDCAPKNQLTGDEWRRVFREAGEDGIGFILLAGGEPLMRPDVLRAAGEFPDIVFPVFTNGVFISKTYFDLFDDHRNLIPVLSIEGGRERTDDRRGEGVYDRQAANMAELRRRGILFGTSVTVTAENLPEVTSEEFIGTLAGSGCGLVIYVEYVPVSPETQSLAPGDAEREVLTARIAELRKTHPELLFLSFPGDEVATGGCIAAGRGFFHINSHGDAEPCPFSPYSDTNIRDCTLREALQSGLFLKLRDAGILQGDHSGGCVLFAQQETVKQAAAACAGKQE